MVLQLLACLYGEIGVLQTRFAFVVRLEIPFPDMSPAGRTLIQMRENAARDIVVE
jgi:hypothetical protein